MYVYLLFLSVLISYVCKMAYENNAPILRERGGGGKRGGGTCIKLGSRGFCGMSLWV